MIYRVRKYAATFDDNRGDAPGLQTNCTVIADGLVRTWADAESMLSQLRLLCKHRPVIIAAFMPEKTPSGFQTIIASTQEVEHD